MKTFRRLGYKGEIVESCICVSESVIIPNVVLFLLYECNAIPNMLFGMSLSLVLNAVVLGLLVYFLVRITLIGNIINRVVRLEGE